jgi:DNA-binding transcriptional MerR regulator
MATPKKLYKIGEVMKYSDLSRQTIHNYTMLGLILPAERTESGHRLYGEGVFERLKKIERYKRHHTPREVKVLLEKQDKEEAQAKSEGSAQAPSGS